jgi:hypothetical protein
MREAAMGSRLRLWKTEIQKLADEIQIPISICHFPPGTSKWNKIDHRLFSFICVRVAAISYNDRVADQSSRNVSSLSGTAAAANSST